ncbi:MAG: Holliday junction branch migration protein RuvA [Clostridia bacterium]|nr:Holliday junction branch migration protein RuvA [Clostridia bacterium]MBQ1965221.1 Holliday junction branch migration protein RuvA [Clostridia bacterium]
MYNYLHGDLAWCDFSTAVIDCGGVGYQCNITANTYREISGKDRVKLYTYLHVKEDAMTLYGFADEQEKQFFMLLISISGVGPKGALAILSELVPESFAAAVLAEDHRQISRANGVGPKLAQRICLELKDKIAKTNVKVSESQAVSSAAGKEALDDATMVLVSLGYSKHDAAKALEKCTADNTNDLVRQALRILSKI